MSDEREAMVAAIRALMPPSSLGNLHKAIIKDQDGNTVGVELPSASAPSSKVKPAPVWFGLPGFSAEFNPASTPEISIGFYDGSESGAFATLFPYYNAGSPSPIIKLSYLGGTKPVARVDDSVGAGMIRFTNTPPAPGPIPTGYIIERIDSDGTVTPLGAVVGPVAVVPSPLVIPISGKITSGCAELLA